MNHRQLSYFLEVYHSGSIASASKKLMISPQGLSKTIISLEQELGIALFSRSGKKMIPTKDAINLVSHASSIVNEFKLIEEKRFIGKSALHTLYIPVAYDAMSYFSTEFYAEFHNRYPDIILRFEELPDSMLRDKLNDGSAELAVIPGPINPDKYTSTFLYRDRFYMMVNKDNPLAESERLTQKDLVGQPLITKSLLSSISKTQFNDFLSNGSETMPVLEISDLNVIREMVIAGHGIGYGLKHLMMPLADPRIKLIPLHGSNSSKSLYLVHKPDKILSMQAQIFSSFILHYVGKDT